MGDLVTICLENLEESVDFDTGHGKKLVVDSFQKLFVLLSL